MPFCEFLLEEIGIVTELFESLYNLGPCRSIRCSIGILHNSRLSLQMPIDLVQEDRRLLMEKAYSVSDMILYQSPCKEDHSKM